MLTHCIKANIFSVMRQVYFSPNDKKSLVMMIFINGIPVLSFEMKMNLQAECTRCHKKYKEARDPKKNFSVWVRLM
jgi:type I restriction enzyme R subunit